MYTGGPNQGQPIGDGAMLDDRWASFMNYGFILGDPTHDEKDDSLTM